MFLEMSHYIITNHKPKGLQSLRLDQIEMTNLKSGFDEIILPMFSDYQSNSFVH